MAFFETPDIFLSFCWERVKNCGELFCVINAHLYLLEYVQVCDRCCWLVTETADLLKNPVNTTVPTCAVGTTTLTCNSWLVVWRHRLEVCVVCVYVHVCTLDCTLPLPPPLLTHTACDSNILSVWSIQTQWTFSHSLSYTSLRTCTVSNSCTHSYTITITHLHTTKTCNLCLVHCMWMRVGNKNNILHVYNTVFTPLCACWQYGAHHWILQ